MIELPICVRFHTLLSFFFWADTIGANFFFTSHFFKSFPYKPYLDIHDLYYFVFVT